MSSGATAIIRTEPVGARYLGGSEASFAVWAPKARHVSVHLLSPVERVVPLTPADGGYFVSRIDRVEPGVQYRFRLDNGEELPDPASRYQPDGVHGPSEIVDTEFPWTDKAWMGIPLRDVILYELHIGTFTPAGTFDSAIEHLPYLKDLGVTAIEIMPIGQFPGKRNWGYDVAYPYAVQASYGGPAGFKRFVDAAHAQGLAVVLDVVYNHLGPEGNYLPRYGDYFTRDHHTPWGQAVNFDGPGSSAVRQYVLDNVAQWIGEFHVDGLRLDAVHAIFDTSERHILTEIRETATAHARGRLVHVFAESDDNDVNLVKSRKDGGIGLDGVWNDDFHHSVHALLTSERTGYYTDFGGLDHLAKALQEGFVYSGQFSTFRGQRHGSSSAQAPAERLVAFIQNHDQVGNRMFGERLRHLLTQDELKLAAGILLLAPAVPLLFMGQEYADTAPFLYFVSHSDPDVIEAVREGRRREFRAFEWKGEVPDPQAEASFARSKVDHSLRERDCHKNVYDFYRELIQLRKAIPSLRDLSKEQLEVRVCEKESMLTLRRWSGKSESLALFNFGALGSGVTLDLPEGTWEKALDSADPKWQGPGSRVPESIQSNGRAWINMPRKSFCLLTKVAG
jgi:maltooligosyltrehalose trehalohydrolase